MKINKKFLAWLVPFFLVTLILYVVFLYFKIDFLEQITLAVFTGLLITIITSWIGYLHAKEEFFTDLFFKSLSMYISLERSRVLLSKRRTDTDIRSLVNTLNSFINNFEEYRVQVNFMLYDPINKKSKEFELMTLLQSLFFQFSSHITTLSVYIKISQLEFEILENKTIMIKDPCSICQIPTEQRPKPADCSDWQEYSKKIQIHNQKINYSINIRDHQISEIQATLLSLMPIFNNYMSELNPLVRINFSWNETREKMEENINATIDELIKTKTQD